MQTTISPKLPKIDEAFDLVEPAPSSESTTDRDVPPHERAVIAEVFRRALAALDAELADDLLIAVQVRERDAADTGERILLEDFVVRQGYDPSDFGLNASPGSSPSRDNG